MATQTASTRQPFAPLGRSQLQSLTNIKNRQNAIISPVTSSTKRKAQTFDSDTPDNNNENIDPTLFFSPKRTCPSTSTSSPNTYTYTKPTNYFLTRAPPSPNFSSLSSTSVSKTTSPIQSRKILSPKARTGTPKTVDTSRKIGANGNGGATLSAPAGRSPTRKRVGILNRRKTSTGTGTPTFTRVEPPRFTLAPDALGFSIDAALSGTIPSYTSRPTSSTSSTSPSTSSKPENAKLEADFQGIESIPLLHTETAKPSWFFSIHEDTEEELATNLMEHSTCTLDISSDEEEVVRERDFRGKENIAPVDDVSQTRAGFAGRGERVGEVEGNEMLMDEVKGRLRRDVDEGEIEVDREPLGALAASDFFPEGVDESSVFVLVEEASEDVTSSDDLPSTSEDLPEFDLSPNKGKEIEFGLQEQIMVEEQAMDEKNISIDELMTRDAVGPRKAALLQPIEKAEEGWTLWESGSVDGEEGC